MTPRAEPFPIIQIKQADHVNISHRQCLQNFLRREDPIPFQKSSSKAPSLSDVADVRLRHAAAARREEEYAVPDGGGVHHCAVCARYIICASPSISVLQPNTLSSRFYMAQNLLHRHHPHHHEHRHGPLVPQVAETIIKVDIIRMINIMGNPVSTSPAQETLTDQS